MNRAIYIIAFLIWTPLVGQAFQPDPPPVSDLDRRLLDDLSPPADSSPQAGKAGGEGEDLGAEGQPVDRLTQELARLSGEMKTVSERLKSSDAAAETQIRQADIAGRLKQLIAELENQQGGAPNPSPSAASQAPPPAASRPQVGDQPADDPQKTASGEPPLTPEDLKSGAWGHLPERWRRQMATGAAEQFLPEYQDLIEAYYRRLAETPAP